MTDYRTPFDPYTTSFEATVERVDGEDVVLDTTYFYAEGGGQPADSGTIDGIEVVDVQKRAGEVVHRLAETPPLDSGERIHAEIDPAFRTYCMRAHTASHALYGAGRRLLDDLGYGGFAITDEKVRVDFSTPTTIDDDTLAKLERLVNRVVWESRDVTWETYPEDEALAMDDIAFNTKTEEGIAGDTVRVVEIDDWDVAACGGTHVSNTREIGPVTVLDRSNPGEGLTRVEMAVGPPGIDRRIEEKRTLVAATRAAGTSMEELPDEIERLRSETEALEGEIESLRAELVDAQLADLRESAFDRDGDRWLVGALDGLDANALGEHAKELLGHDGDVVALVGEDGSTVLAVAADGADASAIVDDVTDEFGGGGGGSPHFAQAGGVDADPETVVAFLGGE